MANERTKEIFPLMSFDARRTHGRAASKEELARESWRRQFVAATSASEVLELLEMRSVTTLPHLLFVLECLGRKQKLSNEEDKPVLLATDGRLVRLLCQLGRMVTLGDLWDDARWNTLEGTPPPTLLEFRLSLSQWSLVLSSLAKLQLVPESLGEQEDTTLLSVPDTDEQQQQAKLAFLSTCLQLQEQIKEQESFINPTGTTHLVGQLFGMAVPMIMAELKREAQADGNDLRAILWAFTKSRRLSAALWSCIVESLLTVQYMSSRDYSSSFWSLGRLLASGTRNVNILSFSAALQGCHKRLISTLATRLARDETDSFAETWGGQDWNNACWGLAHVVTKLPTTTQDKEMANSIFRTACRLLQRQMEKGQQQPFVPLDISTVVWAFALVKFGNRLDKGPDVELVQQCLDSVARAALSQSWTQRFVQTIATASRALGHVETEESRALFGVHSQDSRQGLSLADGQNAEDAAASELLFQNAKALNEDILSRTTLTDVLDLFVQKENDPLDAINVATFFFRVGKLSDSSSTSSTELLSDSRWARLLCCACEMLVLGSSIGTSQQRATGEDWQQEAEELCKAPSKTSFDVTSLSSVLFRLARLRVVPNQIAVDSGEGATWEQQRVGLISSSLEIRHKIALHDEETSSTASWQPMLFRLIGQFFNVSASSILEMMDQSNVVCLCNIVESFVSVGRADATVLDAAATRLLEIARLNQEAILPRQYCSLLASFAELGIPSQGRVMLVEHLANALEEDRVLESTWTAMDWSMATSALVKPFARQAELSTAEDDDQRAMGEDATLRVLRRACRFLEREVETFKASDLSTIVAAFAAVGFGAVQDGEEERRHTLYAAVSQQDKASDEEAVARTLRTVARNALQRHKSFYPKSMRQLVESLDKLGHVSQESRALSAAFHGNHENEEEWEEKLQKAKATNSKILSFRYANEVLDLFVSSVGDAGEGLAGGGVYTGVNFATSLSRLAKLPAPKLQPSTGTILQDTRFQLLVCNVGEAMLLGFGEKPPTISTASIAFEELARELLSSSPQQTLQARELSDIIWSLEKMNVVPSGDMIPLVRVSSQTSFPQMQIDMLAACLRLRNLIQSRDGTADDHGAAEALVNSILAQLYDVAVEYIFQMIDSCTARGLTSIMWSYAASGRADAMILDTVYWRLIQEPLLPGSYSIALWSYATAKIRSRGQVSLVLSLATVLDDIAIFSSKFSARSWVFTAQSLAQLMSLRDSLRTLPLSDEAVVAAATAGDTSDHDQIENDAVLRIMRRVCSTVAKLVETFPMRDINMMLWSMATVGFGAARIEETSPSIYVMVSPEEKKADQEAVAQCLRRVAATCGTRTHSLMPRDRAALRKSFRALGHVSEESIVLLGESKSESKDERDASVGAKTQAALSKAKDLNKEILTSGGGDNVLELFLANVGVDGLGGGGVYDEVNLATSLRRLAQLSPSSSSMLSDPRFALLICNICEIMVGFKDNARFNEWRSSDPDLNGWEGMEDQTFLTSHQQPYIPMAISTMMWALAKLRVVPAKNTVLPPSEGVNDDAMPLQQIQQELVKSCIRVRRTVATKIGKSTREDDKDAIPGFSRLVGQFYSVLSFHVLETIDDFDTQGVCHVLWSHASVGRANPSLFDAGVQQVLQLKKARRTSLSHLEYSTLMNSLGRANVRCAAQLSLVKELANSLGDEKFAAQWSAVSWSKTALALSQLIERRRFLRSSEIKTSSQPNVVASTTILGDSRESDNEENDWALGILRRLCWTVEHHVEKFQPRYLATIISAFASLGFGAPGTNPGECLYVGIPRAERKGDEEAVRKCLITVARHAQSRTNRFTRHFTILEKSYKILGYERKELEALFHRSVKGEQSSPR